MNNNSDVITISMLIGLLNGLIAGLGAGFAIGYWTGNRHKKRVMGLEGK